MHCTLPDQVEASDGSAAPLARDPRTNTLLSVSAELRGGTADFRVRDVSSSGALLEGPRIPAEGEEITVYRHERRIAASVVWARGNRCGVRFQDTIDVTWFIGRGKTAAPPAHQARVDAIQAQLRAPGASLAAIPEPQPASARRCAPLVELGYVERLLESLVDDLTADPYILNRYGPALQKIDVAQQTLQKVRVTLAKG